MRTLCFDILMGPQNKRPWLKGQRSILTFEKFYSHCLISFNISSKNNDFGFNSIKESTFQKMSHLNALGSKGSLTLAMGKCLWFSVKIKV